MQGLIRGADLVLLVVDLGADDGIDGCQELLSVLAATKTRLANESYLDESDIGVSYTRTLLVGNKIDDPEARDRLALLHEFTKLEFPELLVSATQETGLEELRNEIYRALDVVRVYTKLPTAKEADYNRPFTVRCGGTVLDIAELVHNDVAAGFKFARVWGGQKHAGEQVKADYEVQDRDVVEIHSS
jgi:ribosome-interacting GTPase 1